MIAPSTTLQHSELLLETVSAEDLVEGGNSQAMPPEANYRAMEKAYRNSAQYAAMVKSYPVLKNSIDDCQQPLLVGHAPSEQPID